MSKKVDKLETGMKIDVRDTGYIWCTGVVTMIVESAEKEPILAVHYEEWNRWYDEFLPVNSPRIARHGFYTGRDDIPKYKMRHSTQSGRNQMQAFIINRIPPTPNRFNQPSKKSEERNRN